MGGDVIFSDDRHVLVSVSIAVDLFLEHIIFSAEDRIFDQDA